MGGGGGQACERALEPEHGHEKEQNTQGATVTPQRANVLKG